MRYGIVIPASYSSDMWAVARTAMRLYRAGRDLSFYSLRDRVPALDYPLDSVPDQSRLPWSAWVSQLDVLILFSPLPQCILQVLPERLFVAYSDMTLSPWSEWVSLAHTYADQVWVPDLRCVPPLAPKRYVEMLWEPGILPVQPDPDVDRVLLPIWEQSSEYNFREIEAAIRVVRDFPELPITIAYRPSRLRKGDRAALKSWRKALGGRLVLESVGSVVPYRLFTTHSLCFWPPSGGGLGWCPMVAAAFGCAVFTLPVWPLDRVFAGGNTYGEGVWERHISLSYTELEQRFAEVLAAPRLPQRLAGQSSVIRRAAMSDTTFAEFLRTAEA